MMAQFQLAQQQQLPQPPRRRVLEPTTAGPLTTTFDLRSVAASAQSRARTVSLMHQQQQPYPDEVPLTASLGGKFGSRTNPNGLNPHASVFVGRQQPQSEEFIPGHHSSPSFASVVNGGHTQGSNTVMLAPAPTRPDPSVTVSPLKSDSATSWRKPAAKSPSPPLPRNANANARATSQSPPSVVVSRPGSVYSASSNGNSPTSGSPPRETFPLAAKARPQALRFNLPPLSPVATDDVEDAEALDHVLIDNSNGQFAEYEPTTPTPTSSSSSSSSSSNCLPTREEASKRLYEGLGIGRPLPVGNANAPVAVPRQVSQPVRQPRGPPSGVEDLGQRNFAARIRRQAIGGLGVLMGAREKRESLYVEAY